MQRIDVIVDGKTINTNQRSDNTAVWARIRKAAQTAKRVEIARHAVVADKPKPLPAAPFGTTLDAGALAGRGIMLGGNKDVWAHALALAKDGHCDVVAAIPGTPSGYFEGKCRVVTWVPPEREPHAGDIHQAENAPEWKRATATPPLAICLNSWEYGRFPAGTIALVEAYYNEGWGVDFGIFEKYMAQGAKAVIPVGGGYSAPGRTDDEAARIYAALATWSGGRFPGFWMYAGESYLTPQSVDALKAWRP